MSIWNGDLMFAGLNIYFIVLHIIHIFFNVAYFIIARGKTLLDTEHKMFAS